LRLEYFYKINVIADLSAASSNLTLNRIFCLIDYGQRRYHADASEWLILSRTDPTPELKAAFEELLAAATLRNRAVYVRP